MGTQWRALRGLLAVALAAAGASIFGPPRIARPAMTEVSDRAVAVAAGGPAASDPTDLAATTLEIYHTPPVLVRAGESVRLPVHVVCATATGVPCDASVAIRVAAGGGAPWETARAPASSSLLFDLTRPMARSALLGSGGGVTRYAIEARAGTGKSASMPAGGIGTPLAVYTASDMPQIAVQPAPFGRVREGTTVLFLPWGTGRDRAGVALAPESATLGPSSFDVDERGRIHLADTLQARLAVFDGGRLVQETSLALGPQAALAVASDGSSYVLDAQGREASVRHIGPDGAANGSLALGPGIPAEIRAVGGRPFARVLPLDAWVDVGAFASGVKGGDGGAGAFPDPGMPLPDGRRLLRIGREDSLRLGYGSPAGASGAVELLSPASFGDVALAEPDGTGGFWTVVRTWRSSPAADQYQVVHVSGGLVASTFAVSSQGFAETPPSSRFRLGPDGNLYQLVTGPDGVRIVRFDLGSDL
jgi:hypothetical protein